MLDRELVTTHGMSSSTASPSRRRFGLQTTTGSGGGDDGPEASLMDSISSAVACGRDTALRDDGDDPPEDYAPISATLSAAIGV